MLDNSMMDLIYLDHNATTPTRPEVDEAMARCYAEGYANPASQHRPGQRARQVLEDAREAIAEILGADLSAAPPDRLIFTSGGTEANTLAVLGIARAGDGKAPGRVIVSAIEHASVIEPAEHLMDQGWRLDTLGVTPDGVVQVERLPGLLGPETRLVSVMLGNHETGVLQPVSDLVPICGEVDVPLHTDAVQMAGKLPISFRSLGVSAMTVTAHKFQGPLGIGALILRDGVPVEPILFGGHQQSGVRPGTESVALAVGMRTALELWHKEHGAHARRLTALRERFENGLEAGFPDLLVNGSGAARLPHTAGIAFPGLDAQVLLMALDTVGVACSVGSACSSGSTELSPTLLAMGLPREIVAGSLRFSLGATTTEAEIDEAVRRILSVVNELRG
ncbi:MAG: cysteine desulfurase family protein [Planctomycetota bacterium]